MTLSQDLWPSMSLWQHADELVANGEIVIDRPGGSAHPKITEFVYPLDYGYIDGTSGGDGESIDVWVGVDGPAAVTAIACTIDPYKKNAELKLLWRCASAEIALIEEFYAPQPQAVIVLRRESATPAAR